MSAVDRDGPNPSPPSAVMETLLFYSILGNIGAEKIIIEEMLHISFLTGQFSVPDVANSFPELREE